MATPAQKLRLKPVDIPGLRSPIDVPEDGLSLGRDAANHIPLDAETYPYTSSYHARLSFDGDDLVVEDLDSKNGTLVNGRSVTRHVLKAGDIIQFGREVGARFLVVTDTPNRDTLNLSPPKTPTMDTSASTILRVKKALGIPEDVHHVTDLTRSGSRILALTALVLLCFLTVAIGYAFIYLLEVQQELKVSSEELRAIGQGLDEGLAETRGDLARQEDERAKQKALLEAERERTLREGGEASASEIASLHSQLKTTNVKLEHYNPLNLEKEAENRREALKHVLSAIVYIEKKLALREENGDRHLYQADGSALPELRERKGLNDIHFGVAESSSGFCVSAEGWILTNAQVVKTPEIDVPLEFGDAKLVMEIVLDVVFKGTSARHSARIVTVEEEGDDDFAILKIAPYTDMPFIADFDVDMDAPLPGTSVRLFGFPLGSILLQDEDTFTASVFSGIVSRKVDAYLQVQAAVYPGNSGGPVVDEEGHVLGIVTGVQTVPGGQIASDIGYVLPISSMAKMWPPKPLDDASDRKESQTEL